MTFLIAIPVFNEETYLHGVLNEVARFGHDILVIDDGSTDATARILRERRDIAVITHPENRGYGQSMIDAFDYAARRGYDWLITIDCDDQHEPAFIPRFIERAMVGDVDIVSGSRYQRDFSGNTEAPGDRRRINKRITCLLNQTLGYDLTDAFCGFKAYRVAPLSRLRLTVPGYAFPLQFWVQAHHHGLRICELPVTLIYNDPNRYFGGILDDPEARLQHYLDVFHTELKQVAGTDGGGVLPSFATALDDCTSVE